MEVPRFAAVGLSLMLAANCFMPCYTLAYADETQEVADVSQEEQEEISGVASGFELASDFGESRADGADGDSAAEGHGGDLEEPEGSGQDTSSDNGGLAGAVVYDSEPSADYPLVEEGDGGIDESFAGFEGDESASVDYGISPQAIIGGSIVDALIVSSVSGDWNGFQYGNVKWNTNRGTLFWLLSLQFTYIVQQTGIAQAYFKATDTNTKNTVSQISSLRDQIGPAQKGTSLAGWVYTMVVDLQELKSNLGGLQNGVSVSGWLHTLVSNVQTLSNNIGGQQHGASLSGWVYTLVTEIQALRDQIGPLQNETSLSGWVWTIAVKSTNIYDLLDNVTKGSEGGRVSLYNMGNAVEVIKNETRDLDNLLESVHDRLSALDALGVRLANIALIADEIKKGVNSSLQWYDTLHGDLSMLRHGAADLLPGYADWTVWDFLQGIYFDVGQIVDLLKGLQQTLTAWGNRWDSQDLYLMEWAKRWDARPIPDLSFDDGAILAKLDAIRDLLTISAAKDVLDAIFGDMSLDVTGAASAAVGDAIQNAFPFCVPAVLQQILGLLQADPAPPEFHFDFWGAPLDFGFSDWQGLADMTSWLSRIGFAVVLFANSRRFVYSGGVAGD